MESGAVDPAMINQNHLFHLLLKPVIIKTIDFKFENVWFTSLVKLWKKDQW